MYIGVLNIHIVDFLWQMLSMRTMYVSGFTFLKVDFSSLHHFTYGINPECRTWATKTAMKMPSTCSAHLACDKAVP